jgi:hypothetical protein
MVGEAAVRSRSSSRSRRSPAGSFAVPSEAWIRGEPGQQSFVLPWTVATLKEDLHVVGRQGSVTNEYWTGIVPEDADGDPVFGDLDERVFREYAGHLAGGQLF